MDKSNKNDSSAKSGVQKIKKNKAASWCCEASTTIDVKEMIDAIKKCLNEVG